MHIQEVFNAIYSNHNYEYLILNINFRIIEYSDKVFEFCDSHIEETNNIFDLIPELFGLEDELMMIFKAKKKFLKIPCIAKSNNRYINIYVYPGRELTSNDYESIIVLCEDITQIAQAKQELLQEKNENELLLKEISIKNRQLERYAKHMQKLVKEEMTKNLEKQKLIELKSRYAQMGEIIGMITHQWKQPLNAIAIIANVLKLKSQNNLLDKKLLFDKLEDILKQVDYMSKTVLEFQGFFNPLKEKIYFNIFESLKGILELIKTEYSYKNISIYLTGDEKVKAWGLPNELNQVVLSILKNSLDEFTKKPHEDMWIKVNILKKDNKAIIEVLDNAGGIPENIIDKIFDLYVTTKENGSGLGLNISKNMIEEHMDGKIYVQNIDNGAKFTIELPVVE